MNKFLTAVITKVDEAKREVTGVLVEERVDKSNEIFDYTSSKEYFQNWNAHFSEVTDGKSVGNLRAMHKSIAAGKFVEMQYDDNAKNIFVVAKVVNDDEWKNVVEGVYTGFSIGARVVGKRWKDAASDAMRWTGDPFEGSLVDNPCMYGANFTSVKADGTQGEVKFKGGIAKMTKAHVSELIKSATTAIAELSHDETVAKGLYTVSWFAEICSALNNLADCTEYEAEVEGDGSLIPEQIRSTAKQLCNLLVAYVTEEVAEENGEEGEVVEMAANKKTREAGLRPVKQKNDEAGIRPVVEEPEVAAPVVPVVPEPVEPVVEAPAAVEAPVVEETEQPVVQVRVATKKFPVEVITKSDYDALVLKAARVDELVTKNTELQESVDKLNTAVETLKNLPAPTNVRVKGVVVSKESDGVQDENAEVKAATTPLDAIKAIQKRR